MVKTEKKDETKKKEKEEEGKVYTIPLGDAHTVHTLKRIRFVMNKIRKFLKRHTKMEEIKISPEINALVSSRGIKKPSREIKVKVMITDDNVLEAVLVK